MFTCGQKGFTTKSGEPCGYKIGEFDDACPHHTADQTRARRFQKKGGYVSNHRQLPDWIDTNEFETSRDIKHTLASIAREVASNPKADLKRATVLIQTCNAAAAVLNTEAVKELNETIMRAEGHGPALVILEGLKQGRTRRLPGVVERKAQKVEDAEEAG